MVLNIFLCATLIALLWVGFVKFKKSHEPEPDEVPHVEVWPDYEPEPGKWRYKNLNAYHGKAVHIMQQFWTHQKNKIQKELHEEAGNH